MSARLRYLALSPHTPRRIAQRLVDLVALLAAVGILIGAFQIPALVLIGLGVDPAAAGAL